MSVSLEFEFEFIGNGLYRAKVFGGWLVQRLDVPPSTILTGTAERDTTDYNARRGSRTKIELDMSGVSATHAALVFIPDPFFLWGAEVSSAVS